MVLSAVDQADTDTGKHPKGKDRMRKCADWKAEFPVVDENQTGYGMIIVGRGARNLGGEGANGLL
jgi:hypothetical protein